MNPDQGNEYWDLLVFVIVIIGMALMFVFTGKKIDELRGHRLPDGLERVP